MTPDDERLEQIKEWWKEYRWTILGGTTLGIAVIGGWTGWNEYTQTQQESASALYQQVSVAVVENNYNFARDSIDELLSDYPKTAYAGKALLLMARASYENGEEDETRRYLLQAIDDATESSTVHTARIRLGQLMIAEKQYEEALELLDIGNMGGFDSHYHELRGDAYRAQEKLKEAQESYRASLDTLAPGAQYATILNLKLNDTLVQE